LRFLCGGWGDEGVGEYSSGNSYFGTFYNAGHLDQALTVAISAPSALFEDQPIRRVYDEATETWWFSVVDIVRVLTQQPDSTVARKYWNKLKQRLRAEGSQLVTNCHQLKLTATDGKNYLTDYRASHEIKQGEEFAILTNLIHEEWSGVSVKETRT